MKDGKLDIRKVDVVFQDPDHAYLRSGLEAGERVVTTNLSTVAQDAPLRTEGAQAPASGSGQAVSAAKADTPRPPGGDLGRPARRDRMDGEEPDRRQPPHADASWAAGSG